MVETTRKELDMTLEEFKAYEVPNGWIFVAVHSNVEFKVQSKTTQNRGEFVREITMHVTIEEVKI